MSAVCADRLDQAEVALQRATYVFTHLFHESLSSRSRLNFCPEKVGILFGGVQRTANLLRDLRKTADGKAAPTSPSPKPHRAKPAPASADVIAIYLQKEIRKRARKAGLKPHRQKIAGCWKDKAVRNFVISLKGEMSLGKAAIAVRERFGERAPARSTIQRLWQKMELVAWVR